MRMSHMKHNKHTSRVKGHAGSEKSKRWSQKAHNIKSKRGKGRGHSRA